MPLLLQEKMSDSVALHYLREGMSELEREVTLGARLTWGRRLWLLVDASGDELAEGRTLESMISSLATRPLA